MGTRASISVVIPALDEEALVGDAVRSVRADAEVIVVDGGSHDRTGAVARTAGAIVLDAPRGRGRQLDCGARSATGDWIVFLHADTCLEPGWPTAVTGLEPDVVGGAFRFSIDSPRRPYRWLEAGVGWRCALLGLPYGDQGLFVRRAVYGMIGGFRPFPLLEDVEFVSRLKRAGRLAFPPIRAVTSARRWERHGLVATSLKNWCILGLYAAGWAPERLAALYGERET